MKKENKVVEIVPPDFETYYTATVIKTVWHRQRNRHSDQWTRTENPELAPYKYGPLIFGEGAKAIQQREVNLFKKCCWSNWLSTGKTKRKPQPKSSDTLYKISTQNGSWI